MGVYKTGGHTFCLEGRPMRKDKPSKTARKVALNIVTYDWRSSASYWRTRAGQAPRVWRRHGADTVWSSLALR